MRSYTHEELNNGILLAGFKDMNEEDFKKILLKLAPQGEPRPPTCRKRKLDFSDLYAMLPPPVPMTYLNFVGNTNIGNDGMAHLHLIPETVVNLDLSQCGLISSGVERLCEFLSTNTFITRMCMWGNTVGDEGAKHIADMLRVNTTIQNLCIMDCKIGVQGFQHLSEALAVNTTLRILDIGLDPNINDNHFESLCPGLKVNRGLTTLNISSTNVTFYSVMYLIRILRHNFYLEKVVVSHHTSARSGTLWNRALYLMKLNQCNRKIVESEDATLSDWLESVIRGSQEDLLDFSYFFLRHKPELCMYSRSEP